MSIYDGLHSYSTYNQALACRYFNSKVYKAVIPKGTEYYYNPKTKEYVSLKLEVYRTNYRLYLLKIQNSIN